MNTGPATAPFLERISPILDRTAVFGENLYFRFSGSLDELNEFVSVARVLSEGGRAYSTDQTGKAKVYASVADALKASAIAGSKTTYVIGVNHMSGNVVSVKNAKTGRPLTQYYAKGGCGGGWSD